MVATFWISSSEVKERHIKADKMECVFDAAEHRLKYTCASWSDNEFN